MKAKYPARPPGTVFSHQLVMGGKQKILISYSQMMTLGLRSEH